MGVTLETRKHIDKLTISDFSTFPGWEFDIDEEGTEGRDETWVRPLDTQVVPAGRTTQYRWLQTSKPHVDVRLAASWWCKQRITSQSILLMESSCMEVITS